MNFDVFITIINNNIVYYFTGSYWMTAVFYSILIFMLLYALEIGLKYSAAFSIVGLFFFIAIGWYNTDLIITIYNFVLVILGIMLGYAVLKWIGDW